MPKPRVVEIHDEHPCKVIADKFLDSIEHLSDADALNIVTYLLACITDSAGVDPMDVARGAKSYTEN